MLIAHVYNKKKKRKKKRLVSKAVGHVLHATCLFTDTDSLPVFTNYERAVQKTVCPALTKWLSCLVIYFDRLQNQSHFLQPTFTVDKTCSRQRHEFPKTENVFFELFLGINWELAFHWSTWQPRVIKYKNYIVTSRLWPLIIDAPLNAIENESLRRNCLVMTDWHGNGIDRRLVWSPKNDDLCGRICRTSLFKIRKTERGCFVAEKRTNCYLMGHQSSYTFTNMMGNAHVCCGYCISLQTVLPRH